MTDSQKETHGTASNDSIASTRSTPSRGMWVRLRSHRHARWIGALAILAAIIVAVALTSGGSATPADTPTATKASSDSIVRLDSAALKLAAVETTPASAVTGDTLVANGTITYDANHVALVAPRAEGRIISVKADLGQEVSAGDILAEVESPDVGQTRGDLARATAAVSVAKRNYEREKRLYEQEISPQKEMLDAEVLYRTAEADLSSAAAKLRTYGATSGEGGGYGLRSAVTGTVVERNATPGQIVGPTAVVFTVANLRHVWITVDVYEADLGRIHPGAAVTVTSTAFPEERFAGRVTFAGGIVDSMSRTMKTRVVVENPSRRLRPGMFAQARIVAPSGKPSGGVTLPSDAVQDLNGQSVVFVMKAPGQFVARRVVLSGGPEAARGSKTILVTQGIREGERVVTKGAFQLKAELTKASFAGEE
ncbi:MAG: efflux RND transporter periplasmic adaptor subunit [Gemmatimonadota bacterium]